MKIEGEFPSHLRFTGDIFLCTETPQELQQMLQELSDESRRMGLKMNIAKTKVMFCRQHPNKGKQCADRKCPMLRVLGTTLQPQGKEPGQRDTTKNHCRLGGIRQTPGHLHKQPCHLSEETGVQLLCAASYGAETWTLTKQAQNKLAAAKPKMERSMLNITYKYRKTNIWVRERTKVIDIINTVR